MGFLEDRIADLRAQIDTISNTFRLESIRTSTAKRFVPSGVDFEALLNQQSTFQEQLNELLTVKAGISPIVESQQILIPQELSPPLETQPETSQDNTLRNALLIGGAILLLA